MMLWSIDRLEGANIQLSSQSLTTRLETLNQTTTGNLITSQDISTVFSVTSKK